MAKDIFDESAIILITAKQDERKQKENVIRFTYISLCHHSSLLYLLTLLD